MFLPFYQCDVCRRRDCGSRNVYNIVILRQYRMQYTDAKVRHKKVKEHLCGIYEFLETKKMESLQELEK